MKILLAGEDASKDISDELSAVASLDISLQLSLKTHVDALIIMVTTTRICLVIPSLIVVYLPSYYIHIFWLLAGPSQFGGSAEAD